MWIAHIVNDPDIVPKLPFLGFSHVCHHQWFGHGRASLRNYLHLLDPKQPLQNHCIWPPDDEGDQELCRTDRSLKNSIEVLPFTCGAKIYESPGPVLNCAEGGAGVHVVGSRAHHIRSQHRLREANANRRHHHVTIQTATVSWQALGC